MKKKIKPALPAGRKLNLNKRTISNLDATEMSKYLGGADTNGQNCAPATEKCHPFTWKCRPSW